jgi:hypothetical protein
MSRVFLLGTEQFSFYRLHAAILVDVRDRLRSPVTAVSVTVLGPFYHSTDQRTGSVPAGIIMDVDNIVRLSAKNNAVGVIAGTAMYMEAGDSAVTHKPSVLGLHLITGFRMGMFLKPTKAFLFQGNGRKNQCVGGNKGHNAAQHPRKFPEKLSGSVMPQIGSDHFCQRKIHKSRPPF